MEKAKAEMSIKPEDTPRIWSQRTKEFEKIEGKWEKQAEEAGDSAGRGGGDRKILCIYLGGLPGH